MSDITTAFWGMTINNYDETDLALVRQGYPDFIRQIVYTLEEGEQGTPHIQAYLKLYRQQRLSYVKKLFPRGNFKALTNDEYKLNAQRYAQKLDGTSKSPATITNNPFPDAVNELLEVLESAYHWYGEGKPYYNIPKADWDHYIHMEHMNRVREKPHLAKFYISAQYKALLKEYRSSFVAHIFERKEREKKLANTYTHTHTDEKFSLAEDIPDGEDSSGEDGEASDLQEGCGGSEGDQDSASCEDERSVESGSSSGSSSHDSEESGEQSDWE